jgi:hypothetical protein
MTPDLLTQDLVKRFLRYDPETGDWTWIEQINSRVEVGDAAGTISVHGYRIITFFGYKYRSARLAFLYMTGRWPDKEVDHENRCKTDDRWVNLRDVTRSDNQINRDLQGNNTSGERGIHWDTNRNKWFAQVKRDNVTFSVGRYDTMEEAVSARDAFIETYDSKRNVS